MIRNQQAAGSSTSSLGELSIDLRVRISPAEARAEALIDDEVVWWAETRQDPTTGLFGVFASDDRDDPMDSPFDHDTRDSAAADLARFAADGLDWVLKPHLGTRLNSVTAMIPELPFRVVDNRIVAESNEDGDLV